MLMIFLASGLLAVGYVRRSSPKNKKKTALYIVATTSMIGDVITHIVQKKGCVEVIIKGALDPHSHKTTLQDTAAISGADLVFKNGLHLEGTFADDLEKINQGKGNQMQRVYSVSNALSAEEILREESFSGGKDPHIWFDVQLWIKVTKFISEKIQALDNANAAYYQQNTEAYIKKLAALEKRIAKASKEIPDHKKVIIMPHSALGYLAKRYGFQVVSLQGVSKNTEPSIGKRKRIVDIIQKNDIHAVFLEPSSSDKGMRAIQEECADRFGCDVTCYKLYTDALAERGAAANYIGMMDCNINTIKKALLT